MEKKIAIIIGHPDSASFCHALSHAYAKGAKEKGAYIRFIDLGQIKFNPILQYGYRKRTELEEDLLAAQEAIRWADHLVFVYPTWWGTMPAVLKGFIDRVFLPGFSFKSKPDSIMIERLLKGKSARLIVTMDAPPWYYRFFLKRAGHTIMKRAILQFCGVNPVRITEIGTVKTSSPQTLENWVRKVQKLGLKEGVS